MPFLHKGVQVKCSPPFLRPQSLWLDMPHHDQGEATISFPAKQYSNSPWPTVIFHPTDGRPLSWSGWLVSYQDS